MSSIDEQTFYSMNISITTKDGVETGGPLALYAEGGANDAGVLAVAAAIEAAPWPSGVTARVEVFKVDQVQTSYQRDPSLNPPDFT